MIYFNCLQKYLECNSKRIIELEDPNSSLELRGINQRKAMWCCLKNTLYLKGIALSISVYIHKSRLDTI